MEQVLFDAAGEFQVGELVDARSAERVRERRASVVTIPVDEDRILTTLSGFVYRDWGRGWTFDAGVTTRGCPMALAADGGRAWVHWVAAVVPINQGRPLEGQLRLVADGSQGLPNLGMSQDVIPPRFEENRDPRRPLVIRGRNRLSVFGSLGLVGVGLYGTANNVAVIWSAVSVCSSPGVDGA